MRWRGRRRSSHVEDRRGMRKPLIIGGGVGGVVLVVVMLLMGGNPLDLITGGGGQPVKSSAQDDEKAQFVAVVLADTEDVWRQQFQAMGKTYREPKLVLFTDRVQSDCGFAGAAIGPFYCPADQTIYIDLSFFQQLDRKLGAPGDFAQAYVIAHEVGHHVQRLLGYADRVDRARGNVGEREMNRLSVRQELQADFLAGVWAHHAQRMKQVLEPGDIEEAINAAEAIGDDTLQKRSQGQVVPDSFTHGTSAQRVRWFRLGYETGDVRQGDTFDEDHFAAVESGRRSRR